MAISMKRNTLIIIATIIFAALFLYLLIFNKTAIPVYINVSYVCKDNKTIEVAISERFPHKDIGPDGKPIPNGQVHIKLSDGRVMDLSQTLSASGVRYANNDESFIFWSKGNSALVLEDNKEKSYIGCILVKDKPQGSNLDQVYLNNDFGFTLRHSGYSVDDKFVYSINSTRQIRGVRFLIPNYIRQGTNLSSDSYISVETIPRKYNCRAELFLEGNSASKEITENQITYSVASSSGAGAGNRYEEIVYAFPDTNPCMGVRYFIHFGAIQNYDFGAVKEFDRSALLREFDLIRSTLVMGD